MEEFHKGQKYQYLIDFYPVKPEKEPRRNVIRRYVKNLSQEEINNKVIDLKNNPQPVYTFKQECNYGSSPKIVGVSIKKYRHLKKSFELYNHKFNIKNFKNSKYRNEIFTLLLINNRLEKRLPIEMLLMIFESLHNKPGYDNNFYLGRCYQFLIDSGKNINNVKNLKQEAQHRWYTIISKNTKDDSVCMKHGYDYCGNSKCYLTDDENGQLKLDDTSIFFYVECC